MLVTINISNDFSLGVLTHNVLFPPAIPAPVPMLSFEMIATMYWPPGFAMNQNKLTTTVKHKMMCIVQDGHDSGMLILDITPPQLANAWYAVMWPLSSRKIVFAASKVKVDKIAVGCTQPYPVPLPMMTCGDPVSAPTAMTIINKLNTMNVGMTIGDLLAGIAAIAFSMILDFVFNKLGGKTKPKVKVAGKLKGLVSKKAAGKISKGIAAKEGVKSIRREIGEEYIKKFIPWGDKKAIGRWFAKKGLASASDFVISVFRGDPTLKLGTGIPQLGGGITIRGSQGGTRDSVVAQGNVVGLQRDTSDGGANFGQEM